MEEITYKQFIQKIIDVRGRFMCGEDYRESHHIIPKCVGGSNDNSNLIELSPKEHYEAHRLLALENPDNKSLTYAWWMMSHIGRVKISSEEYDEARRAFAEANKGRIVTDETREKISKQLKGRTISEERKRQYSIRFSGNRNPFYGKHHSEETKQKIRDNQPDQRGEKSPFYGKHHSDETKRKISETKNKIPVVQVDKVGKYLCEFESAREAERITGVPASSILLCCYGKCKSAGGFIWFTKDEYDPTTQVIYQDNSKKPVVQLDKNGVFLQEYESCCDAERKTGIDANNIWRCCSVGGFSAGGYLWVLKAEYNPLNTYKYSYNPCIPVVCLSIDGQYICEYASIAEASAATGADCSAIIRCCKGKQKTSMGFCWMYKDDWDRYQNESEVVD